MGELDRVLGGGAVKGSLVLVGGAPGIGKSTILLQVLRDLDRIELDQRIEEYESEDADEVCNIVERAATEVAEPFYDDVVTVREEECHDR